MKKDFYFYQAKIREIFSVLSFILEDKWTSDKFLNEYTKKLQKSLKELEKMFQWGK
jgi:hypothetical protein